MRTPVKVLRRMAEEASEPLWFLVACNPSTPEDRRERLQARRQPPVAEEESPVHHALSACLMELTGLIRLRAGLNWPDAGLAYLALYSSQISG